MRSRAYPLVTAAVCAILIAPIAGSAVPPAAEPVVIQADAERPVLIGSIATSLVRKSLRTGLLVAVRTQAPNATPEEVTDELTRIARTAVPAAALVPWPIPGESYVPHYTGAAPTVPNLRIDLGAATNDGDVRDAISRFDGALNALDPKDPAAQRADHRLQYVASGCADLDASFETETNTRVRRFAAAIGIPLAPTAALRELRKPQPIDGPVARESACIDGHSTFTEPAPSAPSSASFRTLRYSAFAQPIRFDVGATSSPARGVSVGGYSPPGNVRVHLRAPSPLLTVEGTASFEARPAGTFYEYRGPNGLAFTRDIALDHLERVRERLRALGIADPQIVTQLEPGDARWYVSVRSSDVQPRDAIVTAIAGQSEDERAAVLTTAFGDACAEQVAMLKRAVDDAASHATRVAAGLRASLDPRPVMVEIESGSAWDDCVLRGTQFGPAGATARHVSGELPRAALGSGDTMEVVASFPIAHPTLTGTVSARPASDDPTSFPARFGYVPPPIEYDRTAAMGEAKLEARFQPRTVRVSLSIGPDNRHGFAPIDAGLAPILAATLGASEAQYSAQFERGPSAIGQTMLTIEADVSDRGTATADAVRAALAAADNVGFAQLSVLPENDDCTATADALARDTIRAAARDAPAPARGGRLVAIDLRGPFTVDGRCTPARSGVPSWAGRGSSIPDVRIAAYARVSYGK